MNTEIAKLEKKRKLWVTQTIIFIVTFVMYVLYTISSTLIIREKPVPAIYALYIFYVIWILVLILQKGKLKTSLTKQIMQEALKEELKTLKYDVESGIPERYFVESEFLKKYTNYYTSNYLAGVLENNFKFQLADIAVTKRETDMRGNKQTVTLFKGIFAVLEKDKVNEFDLAIMPDVKNKYMNQILNGFKKMTGVKDIVRLENTEFERYFEVYSDNQIEARKIITVEFMEKLLALRKRFDKPITVLYKKNKVYFFANRGNIVAEKDILYKGVTTETIHKTTKIIMDLYDTMKLL